MQHKVDAEKRCKDCNRKAYMKNSYGEHMCYECHNDLEEQEYGREISKERSDGRPS